MCDGVHADCPPDHYKPDGAACTDGSPALVQLFPDGFPGQCFNNECITTHAACQAVSAYYYATYSCPEEPSCASTRCTYYSSFSPDGSCGTGIGVAPFAGVPCIGTNSNPHVCDGDGACVPVDAVHQSATPCHSSCASCDGPLPGDCLSCNAAAGTPWRLAQLCLAACPPGFLGVDHLGQCVPCDASCATCSALHAQGCTACDGAAVLAGGACVAQCPAGSSLTAGTECTCDDPALVLDRGSCVTACSEGSYPDAARVCRPCADSCAECTGPTSADCTACHASSLKPVLVSAGGVCAASCAVTEFVQDGKCTACHASCGTCSSALASGCTSCPAGSVLHGSVCLAACPTGFYSLCGTDTAAGCVCLTCDATCAECVSSSATCTACPATAAFLLDATCVDECPPGHYAPPGTSQCQLCDGVACAVACDVGFYAPEGAASTDDCAPCDQCGGAPCRGPAVADCHSCGDGVVDDGEQCDCGNDYGCHSTHCCDAQCRLKPTSVCDPTNPATPCCTASCGVAPDTDVCRPSAGACDPTEMCTGTSTACPPNRVRITGFTCTSDTGATGACQGPRCATMDAVCRQYMQLGSSTQYHAPPACTVASSCSRGSCGAVGSESCSLSFSTTASWFRDSMFGVPCQGGQCDEQGTCVSTDALNSGGLCPEETPFVYDQHCVEAW